jgi:hypothetical protein
MRDSYYDYRLLHSTPMTYRSPEVRDIAVVTEPYQKLPWRKMKVGDSIWFPKRDHRHINAMKCKAQRRTGLKFTLRKMTNGVRVWRSE